MGSVGAWTAALRLIIQPNKIGRLLYQTIIYYVDKLWIMCITESGVFRESCDGGTQIWLRSDEKHVLQMMRHGRQRVLIKEPAKSIQHQVMHLVESVPLSLVH